MLKKTEQKLYRDLKLTEKIKLKWEFSGFSTNVVLYIIWLLSWCVVVAGIILFMLYIFSASKQHWHFSGIIMMNVGGNILFCMLQTIFSKERNFFKVLGGKKQILIFFAVCALAITGVVFAFAYIFSPSKDAWLFWAANLIPLLGTLILLIPRIKSPKKIINDIKEGHKSFLVWLEKEKNIVLSAAEKKD